MATARFPLSDENFPPHQRVTGLRSHTLTAPASGLEDGLCKNHHVLPNLYCKTDQTCICGVCMETHHKHHRVVPLEKEYESKLGEVPEIMAIVQSKINARSQRITEIKRVTKRARVFNAQLIHSRPELAETIEDRCKTAEQQATGFIKELNVEITLLNDKRAELERLSHSDDHHRLVLFLSNRSTLLSKDQKNTVVDFNLPDTTCVRRCASLLTKEINLQRLKDCAVDVTLDPDTAHCNLIVSADGKAVMLGATPNVPDTKKRFKHHAVLSQEGFTSGRFYYEVQVKGKTSWAVGVARKSVNRQNPVSMSVGNGCWVMVLSAGQYRAYGSVSSACTLFMKEKPQAVGVFVDYDVGQVSFYDVHTGIHIYTFFGQSFNHERLYAYLCTQSDRKPLTIIPLHLPN